MRFANAEETMILAEDGRIIPVDPGNMDYYALAESGAVIEPWDPFAALDLPALKTQLLALLDAETAALRAQVVGTTDPTKLAVYQQKYELAQRVLIGDDEASTLLVEESLARGLSVSELAQLVVDTGDRWRVLAQRIESASARHKLQILALNDVESAKSYDWRLRIEGL